jgi:hypothetical protein
MRLSVRHTISLAALALAMQINIVHAQEAPPQPPNGTPTPAPATAAAPAPDVPTATTAADAVPAAAPDAQPAAPPSTDILSGRTLSMLLDGRLVAANGEQSFLNRGFGKTRFSGAADGNFRVVPLPVEADLIWTPRFTSSLSGNVSGSWQRGQENPVDLLEAFVTFLPPRGEHISFSAKAGLYWPEISLEHATGGAWSTVYTITPSVINAWVGEEVKFIGAEATLIATLGKNEVSLTGGIFGFNDTSGTLLSFRGWGAHDLKATAFGHIQLPVLNAFMTRAQAPTTRSLLEIDNRPGFYGRVEWRPPSPFSINVFYYDNRGDPTKFNPSLQWGWRTRFANVGLSVFPDDRTRILAQAMYGTTQMGNIPPGQTHYWVDTKYRSAYILVARDVVGGQGQISARFELFDTRERGSRMTPDESENGGAGTIAGRWRLSNALTGYLELLHIRSSRGVRVRTGVAPFEAQTVLQASLRLRL